MVSGVLSVNTQAELDEEFQAILDRYNQEGYSPHGVTGDPDCPYRDWRGTPLEVGARVLYAISGSSSSISILEGEVLAITEKPEKSTRPIWKFNLKVVPVASPTGSWRVKQAKPTTLISVERVTVIF